MVMNLEQRLDALEDLRERFPDFPSFMHFGMNKMGFKSTDTQVDIAKFMADRTLGNRKMVQAARGQAKTTISAFYVQWRLIHHPHLRCMIVTATGTFATDITKMIKDCIMTWPEMECLRPDSRGRQKAESFDVYFDFKGINKSPSILCKGVESALAGNRADLLIGDDIENSNNSKTEERRTTLINAVDEFPNLANDGGDILLLGTPQSRLSVYSKLRERGYLIRIWTGRLPKRTEIANYEGNLAPYIVEKIMAARVNDYQYGIDGTLGYSIDPIINSEGTLRQKELVRSVFQLQFMLDTTLSDADMFPLRLNQLTFVHVDKNIGLPSRVHSTKSTTCLVDKPTGYPIKTPLYKADSFSEEYLPISQIVLAVDPSGAGANGDETGYAVVGQSGDRIVVLDVGGLKGGYSTESFEVLSSLLTKWGVTELLIEKNFGHGGFRAVWENHAMFQHHIGIPIVDVQNNGQKEVRVCDALEPIINSKKLIFDLDIVENDWGSAMLREKDKVYYSLLYQMSNITRERQSLIHDDRIDALSMAVAHLSENLHFDTLAIEQKQIRDREYSWFATQVAGYDSWDSYFETTTHCVNHDTHECNEGFNNGINGEGEGENFDHLIGRAF